MWNLLLKVRGCFVSLVMSSNFIVESSTASANELLTDAAKYFVYKEQAMMAENLTTYVSATTPPLSILLGKIIMFIKCT